MVSAAIDYPIYNIYKFLLLIFLFTILPGVALLSLFNLRFSKIQYFCIASTLGVVLNIAIYYIVSIFRLNRFYVISFLLLLIVSLIVIYINKKNILNLKTNNREERTIVLLSFFIMVINFLTFNLSYLIPTKNFNSYLYFDKLFEIGNTISISNFFPIEDIRVSNLNFTYHYFYNIFASVYKNLGNFDAFNLDINLINIFLIPLFILSVFVLSDVFFKSTKAKIILLILTILCPWLFVHFVLGYYGLIFGLIFINLSVYFFLRIFLSKNVFSKDLILCLIFFMMSLGFKGPLTVTILMAFGLTMIFYMLKNKAYMKMLITGVIFLSVFILFYFVLFGEMVQNPNSISLRIGSLLDYSNLYHNIALFKPQIFTSTRFLNLIVLFILYVFVFPTTTFSFMIMFFNLIFNYKKTDIIDIFSIIASFSGLLLCTTIYQSGASQVYFLFSILCISLCGAIKILIEFYQNKENLHKRKVLVSFTLITICIFSTSFAFSNEPMSIEYQIRNNIINYKQLNQENTSNIKLSPGYHVITKDEYDAMIFLKNNTEINDIILCDRHFIDNSNALSSSRFWYYSTFSERRMYIEGYLAIYTSDKNYQEIIDRKLKLSGKFYNNDFSCVEQLKKDGVKYAIQSNLCTQNFNYDKNYLTIIFKNNDISIYKLN